MTKRPGKASASYSRNSQTRDVTVRLSEELLQQLPASKELVTALREVHANLATATVLYREYGDKGRTGVYRAVSDVIDFFASQGVPRAALEPLSAVAYAVYDAARGTESPIFKPDRKEGDGRPKEPVVKRTFEGLLVTVTECCVRHCKAEGMRPYVEPATKMAARMINRSSWPIRVTATELREIRERVQQSPSSSPDRQLLDVFLSSEVGQDKPLDWAKRLFEHDWANFLPA